MTKKRNVQQPTLFSVEWEEKSFEYQLNNGDVFSLRYWYDGENHIVAGTDLRKSIGEKHNTFSDNFGCRKSDNHPDEATTWKSYRTSKVDFYNLSDAIKYVNKRYEPFQETFIERGVNALVSLEDNDVVGILTALGKSVDDAEEAVVTTATNDKLIKRTAQRIKSIKIRNEFTESIAQAHGTKLMYAEATNQCYKATLDKTASELKREMGLPKSGSIRDNLRKSELGAVMAYEGLVTNGLHISGADGDGQIRQVLRKTDALWETAQEEFKKMFK